MLDPNPLAEIPNKLPKMIVFDLDFTIWSTCIDWVCETPTVYDQDNNSVSNSKGDTIRLYDQVTHIIALIKALPDVKIGIASRALQVEYAIKAMNRMRVSELGNTLLDNIDYWEVYPKDKIEHFKSLANKSRLKFNHMLFFDDEIRNQTVKQLGVHFVKVDSKVGITMSLFKSALQKYAEVHKD